MLAVVWGWVYIGHADKTLELIFHKLRKKVKISSLNVARELTKVKNDTKTRKEATSYQALSLLPLGKDPGERWSRVSQNLGDRNFLLLGWRGAWNICFAEI